MCQMLNSATFMILLKDHTRMAPGCRSCKLFLKKLHIELHIFIYVILYLQLAYYITYNIYIIITLYYYNYTTLYNNYI